jgi:hypothetical protein
MSSVEFHVDKICDLTATLSGDRLGLSFHIKNLTFQEGDLFFYVLSKCIEILYTGILYIRVKKRAHYGFVAINSNIFHW